MNLALLDNKRGMNWLMLFICFVLLMCNMAPAFISSADILILTMILTVVMEFGAILLPALLFMKKRGGVKAFGMVYTGNPMEYVWAILIGAGAFFLATGVNALMMLLWDTLGIAMPDTGAAIYMGEGWRFVAALFSIVIIPAFCEETLFRGALLGSWLSQSRVTAIVHSALLFALIHLNPLSLPALFVIGLLLGTVTALCGSVYPSMIIHAMNNLIALIIAYAGNPSAPALEDMLEDSLVVYQQADLGSSALIMIILGVVIIWPAYGQLKRAVAKREASYKLLNPYKYRAKQNQAGHGPVLTGTMGVGMEKPEENAEGSPGVAVNTAEGYAPAGPEPLVNVESAVSQETSSQEALPLEQEVKKRRRLIGRSRLPAMLTYVLMIIANALVFFAWTRAGW